MTEEKQLAVTAGSEIWDTEVTPSTTKAWEILRTGDVPKAEIKRRAGPGGKSFDYVSHVWTTKQLIQAYGPAWEMRVVRESVYPDGSAIAIVELTTFVLHPDGTLRTFVVQDVGAFQDLTKKMCAAYQVAAATSRGLVKCVMRRYGLGIGLWDKEEEEPTEADALKQILNALENKGVSVDNFKARLAELGIPKDNLLDNFEKAYALVYEMAEERETERAKKRFGIEPEAPVLTDKQQQVYDGLRSLGIGTQGDPAQQAQAIHNALIEQGFSTLTKLDEKQCDEILTRVKAAAKKIEPVEPPSTAGELAKAEVQDQLLSWAADTHKLDRSKVLLILTAKALELGQAIPFDIQDATFSLKDCQRFINENQARLAQTAF